MLQKSCSLILLIVSLTVIGCSSSTDVLITGNLMKGGEKLTPPEGRQIGVTFYLVSSDDTSKNAPPVGEPYQAMYDPTDGTFKVPGRDGYGVPPGKYRIAISQKLTRDALDKTPKAKKAQRGTAPSITRETDFFESSFGSESSKIVREFTSSQNVTIDLDKPEG